MTLSPTRKRASAGLWLALLLCTSPCLAEPAKESKDQGREPSVTLYANGSRRDVRDQARVADILAAVDDSVGQPLQRSAEAISGPSMEGWRTTGTAVEIVYPTTSTKHLSSREVTYDHLFVLIEPRGDDPTHTFTTVYFGHRASPAEVEGASSLGVDPGRRGVIYESSWIGPENAKLARLIHDSP